MTGSDAPVWVRGEGVYLWSNEGQRALDFSHGHVVPLGWGHPLFHRALLRAARGPTTSLPEPPDLPWNVFATAADLLRTPALRGSSALQRWPETADTPLLRRLPMDMGVRDSVLWVDLAAAWHDSGGIGEPLPTRLARARDEEERVVIDESRLGPGRLGTWWASDALGLKPAVVVGGAGFANGLGAVVARGASPPLRGSHPVETAAVSGVLDAAARERSLDNVRVMGEYFLGECMRAFGQPATGQAPNAPARRRSAKARRAAPPWSGRGLTAAVELSPDRARRVAVEAGRAGLAVALEPPGLWLRPPWVVGRGHLRAAVDSLKHALRVEARRGDE